MSTTPNKEAVLALIKRLRQKPSTYNRELLDEAADTIEALLEALEKTEGCDTCKHRLVDVNDEPCNVCYGHSKWEWAGGDS